MESIVSPWIIYLLNLVKSLDFITFFIAFILSLGMIAITAVSIACKIEPDEQVEESLDKINNALGVKVLKAIWVICLSWAIFFPTKDTLIQMYVANEVTYDRAEKSVDIAKDIKNSLKKDIIDIIQEVSKPEEVDK